ncbi:MAG TPA: hypothetical protein VHA14_09765 [Bryobacteraceae bacterium]|nr:hypothetical protein [Bryobacteraceae bacterium]
MKHHVLLSLFPVALASFCAPVSAAGDGNWPREIDTDGIHLVVYQPQVDSWKDNRIEARSAVIVTRAQDPKQIFGIVSISARTEVDREQRLVSFEDIRINDATFPSALSLQPTLLKAIRDSVPNWPQPVSLDRLLADLAITQAETKTESTVLKNDPPKIFLSKTPAVLILIDGEPAYRPVEGTRYTRVVNTPALLLFDSSAGRFYLDGNTWWMTSSSLQGPWTAAANPPSDLNDIRQQMTRSDEPDDTGAAAAAAPAGNPPAVYVSTTPAELLVTQGEPAYAPIPGTSLLYVTNSDNDIFMDTKTQQYFTLLSGRWFRAKSFEGSWEWVAGEQLPGDFARISPTSPKGAVLASIPGTEQAREAVIANQIPQTATVRRDEAKLQVQYSGPPQFRPIEGTSMRYATNTSSEVIYASGRYYAMDVGVWFVADNPDGPWAVADMIPSEIYTIPPSSPLYHVRYVYVYGATPDVVYVGYTPGYLGAFVSGGVVVFGTGWRYPGVFCGDFWCGWPWTWGFSFHFSYWGGGWFWRPVHRFWWYHPTPVLHRVFTEHWSPRGRIPNSAWIRGNVDAYSRWPGNVIQQRNFQPRGRTLPGTTRPDLYAGRDGQVYQHRNDGWYQQNKSGQWQKVPSNPRLNQQRDSRSLGQSRQREFENRGQSPGIPRTTAPRRNEPPARTAPTRPAPAPSKQAPPARAPTPPQRRGR